MVAVSDKAVEKLLMALHDAFVATTVDATTVDPSENAPGIDTTTEVVTVRAAAAEILAAFAEDEGAIERAARVMCEAWSLDPDETVCDGFDTWPRWAEFKLLVVEVIEALGQPDA